MRRDELFVGGDDAFAVFQAALDVGVRRIQSAYDLDDDSDFGIVDDLFEILSEAVGEGMVGEVAYVENVLDVKFHTRLAFDTCSVFNEQLGDS